MSTVSDITRMSGLASGLDTEALVKAATANQKTAINTKKQKLQTLTWKQEAYRSISTALSDFQSKYLDILSSTSVRANAVMKANKATSSNELLSVSATTSASAGKYKITSVTTAKAAEIQGTKASAGTIALDFSEASAGNNTVKFTLDGTTKSITFKGGENAADNFLTALNDAFSPITSASFSFKEGTTTLQLDTVEGDKVSHMFSVGYDSSIGLKNDASNSLSTSSVLGAVDFVQPLVGDSFEFTINGVDFSFDSDTTVSSMMNTINKSDAGVKLSFSSLTQSFTLETTSTGAGQEINVSQTKGNLLNSLFNLSEDQLSLVPTTMTLGNVSSDSSLSFTIQTAGDITSGFSSDDGITINDHKLDLSALSTKQETGKKTIDDEEKDVKYYTMNGKTVYSYSDTVNSTTVYKYEDDDSIAFTVYSNGSVTDSNGNDVAYSDLDSQETVLSRYMDDNGVEVKNKEYSISDIKNGLNNALSSANYIGSFDVSDDGVITYKPYSEDQIVEISVSGNVTVNGDTSASNKVVAPMAADSPLVMASEAVFEVNGSKSVTIAASDGISVTVNDLVNSGYFSYNEETGELSITGTNVLTAQNNGAALIADIFGTEMLAGADSVGSRTYYGSNAQMTINGVTIESASNTITIDGTTFGIEDLDEFTAEDIENGDAEAITVTVEKDTSKIKETILGFVEAYNEIIDKIYGELNTSRPKTDDNEYYDPLTEEEEDELEQDEIDKWNEQAKTGLLYHDTTLAKVATNFRQAINAVVNGFTIQALGIDTSSDYKDYGKLVINDEAELDAAIENYSDEIAAFFTDAENGLGARLNNAVESAISTKPDKYGYLTSVAGIEDTTSATNNQIYNQISQIQTLIETLNERYESAQERLWSQYTTLETYIANMNNQSMSLFGTSSSSSSY